MPSNILESTRVIQNAWETTDEHNGNKNKGHATIEASLHNEILECFNLGLSPFCMCKIRKSSLCIKIFIVYFLHGIQATLRRQKAGHSIDDELFHYFAFCLSLNHGLLTYYLSSWLKKCNLPTWMLGITTSGYMGAAGCSLNLQLQSKWDPHFPATPYFKGKIIAFRLMFSMVKSSYITVKDIKCNTLHSYTLG